MTGNHKLVVKLKSDKGDFKIIIIIILCLVTSIYHYSFDTNLIFDISNV